MFQHKYFCYCIFYLIDKESFYPNAFYRFCLTYSSDSIFSLKRVARSLSKIVEVSVTCHCNGLRILTQGRSTKITCEEAVSVKPTPPAPNVQTKNADKPSWKLSTIPCRFDYGYMLKNYDKERHKLSDLSFHKVTNCLPVAFDQ